MSDQPSSTSPSPARLLGLTARIVSAHAGHNPVPTEQLPELIRAVHRALGGLGQGGTASAEPARLEPAVPIRRSVRHDRLTCLECGGRFSMLKRHLRTEHHLTPEAYRERWGLPRDYPMVAPDYAATRSSLAKQSGLGRKRGGADAGRAKADSTMTPEPAAAPTPDPTPAGRRPRSGPTAVSAARKPRRSRRGTTQETDRG